MLCRQHVFALGIVSIALSSTALAQQAPAPATPAPVQAPPPAAAPPAASAPPAAPSAVPAEPVAAQPTPTQAPATSAPAAPGTTATLGTTAAAAPPPGNTSMMAAEPDVTYDTVNHQQYNYVEQAREYASWTIAYEVAIPVAEFSEYIGTVSPRGIAFTGEFPIAGGLRIGGSINYNRFYGNEARDTYYLENGAVTAKLYRYADVWSLAGLARYRFLKPNNTIRPFVGVGLGVSFLNATTLVADLGFQDSPAGFLFQPEVGVAARMTPGMQALFAVRYSMTTASFQNYDMASYISLQLGLSWDTRL